MFLFRGKPLIFAAIETDSLANLVSQRLDIEILMRQILALEQRLSQLTPESPDYTDGKLVPVTLDELQDRVPIVQWKEFLIRGFGIVGHELNPEVTVLIDQEYLMVNIIWAKKVLTYVNLTSRLCLILSPNYWKVRRTQVS